MNKHPFLWVNAPSRKKVLWASAVMAVLSMAVLQALGKPLVTAAAPAGIVSFELAGSLVKIEAILASWGPAARVCAGLNLGIDYLFIITYVTLIGLGCVLAAESLARHVLSLGGAGLVLAWGVILAGVLDCVENYALIRLLLGSQSDTLAVMAGACAIPKFFIVLLCLLYMIFWAVVSLFLRRRESKTIRI